MTPRRRHGLAATCLLLLALVAVSCSSTVFTYGDAAGERDAFVDAYATWKTGVTTFDDMKAAYGEPNDRTDVQGGFAARWLRTRRVATAGAPAFNATDPVSRFEADIERPRYHTTIHSSLEAFFSDKGVLSSFRIQTDK